MNPGESLADLMRKSQAGDKQAYSLLFAEITPILRSFISHKVNNHDDMEDIVQEILISIHRAGHTFDTDRPFEVWMYTIARYRLNDYLRGYYKNQELKTLIFAEADTFYPEKNVTLDTGSGEYIQELLSELPAKQREIITLMKVEGYTAKETAEMLGMTETAVKVAAHRVYKKLADKLKKIQLEQDED